MPRPTPVYARICRTFSNIGCLWLVSDDVRHEPREIVGHEPVGFPDAEACGLHVDGPDPEHGMVAAVVAEVGELLHVYQLLAVALVGPAPGLLAVEMYQTV